jgi:probable rRNA maturation factor
MQLPPLRTLLEPAFLPNSMSKNTLLLDFQIALPAWRRTPRLRSRLQAAAQATIERQSPSFRLPATATILLTGNAKMRQLNFDFRGIAQATNVLSFPQFSCTELRRLGKQKNTTCLGDIALAYQYVVAEAKKDDKVLANHITHLVVHGLLHLLGYDHVSDGGARRMEKEETEIMASLGLPDPYAALAVKNKTRKK